MPNTPFIALCSAMLVPEGAGLPEYVHLLPTGVIRTQDGRGPYTVKSMEAIAQAISPRNPLPIDECHAIDRAAHEGRPAPARGWIVGAEARQDGLWGQVEWTATGAQLMADRAYRGISPVIAHTVTNEVLRVLRASLINTPNLIGLTSLHAQEAAARAHKAFALDETERSIISMMGLSAGEYLKEKEAHAGLIALQAKEAAACAPKGWTLDKADKDIIRMMGLSEAEFLRERSRTRG